MQNSRDIIYFNFSYFALKLLGKGLYSNHWTAIAELVANGIDAQANSVKIYINMIDKQHSVIEIFDNGSGMDYNDLAEKYVLIGKDKRDDQNVSEEIKRQLMGRKGIGKLAALYLSNKYYLISKTHNAEKTAWCLDASNVKESDIPRLDRCVVSNIDIESHAEWDSCPTGTMIKLTNVDLTNFGVKSIDGLKARLADFYLIDELRGKIEVCVLMDRSDKKTFQSVDKSIAFKNMCAFYNNLEIDFSKRLADGVIITSAIKEINEKKRKVEILDKNIFKVSGEKKFHLPNGEISKDEFPYKMEGWIGIHTSIKKEDAILNDPDYLRNKAYRPNQLRLYVRKKLAVENFLEYVKNTQAFSNYIEGEISFDILDDNHLGDIATSNRQGFVEDDERVQLLIGILNPIINSLIRSRIKLANLLKYEEKAYYEKMAEIARQDEEKRRIKAEEEKRRAEEEREQVEKEKNKIELQKKEVEERAYNLNISLSSEKKRNNFLLDTLGEDQINFSTRLHMLKINISTMNMAIQKSIMKLQRGRFAEEDAWATLKKMSYLTSRIQAVLSYSAIAKFDTREEITQGDLFEFIREYSEEVLNKNGDLMIKTTIAEKSAFVTRFAPQDIAIILENTVSNSFKHKASEFLVYMSITDGKALISLRDNGTGLKNSIDNVDELFAFGKSYTTTGTGVGLFHVKEIVEKKLHGTINIIQNLENGFELQIRI